MASETYDDDLHGPELWMRLHTARTMHACYTETVTRQWVITLVDARPINTPSTPASAVPNPQVPD